MLPRRLFLKEKPLTPGIALLLVLLPASPTLEATEPSTDCIANKYDRYAQAQEDFQRGLTRLISETAPQYTDVAQVLMVDQLNRIERARLEVEYLSRHDPSRLRTDMPVNAWLSLDDSDRQPIASQNDRYAELLRLAAEASDRPPHPDGDGLRALMRDEIAKLVAYKELLAAFSGSVEEIEAIRCD